jgi:hypothetical protein
MRTRYPFITLLAAVGVLSSGAWRAASAATIHLLTGASSVPCGQDANVKFTSTSVLMPQQVVVGTGAPADPCAVQDDLQQPGFIGGKYVSNPASRAYATWQGGIGANCFAATPAKNTTSGTIKAKYR